jgi:hypothetical protein
VGKSTLNRLEHTPKRHGSKYHKIDCDGAQVDALFVELFLEAHERAPREIVLDLDNTDIPLYGGQEGRFFHGYYDEYCYLPLYVFCGRHLLLARQRRANVAGSPTGQARGLKAHGAVEEIARIIAQIRQKWPRVRIILRADSGFSNDALMGWCETNRVDYVLGLARNRRLEAALTEPLAEAKRLCLTAGKPARVFRDFSYRTIDSWSRARRVVGKAEYTLDGANPRFISPRSNAPETPSMRAPSTRISTAPAARRRTASASSSSSEPVLGPAAGRTRGPIAPPAPR